MPAASAFGRASACVVAWLQSLHSRVVTSHASRLASRSASSRSAYRPACPCQGPSLIARGPSRLVQNAPCIGCRPLPWSPKNHSRKRGPQSACRRCHQTSNRRIGCRCHGTEGAALEESVSGRAHAFSTGAASDCRKAPRPRASQASPTRRSAATAGAGGPQLEHRGGRVCCIRLTRRGGRNS